MWNPNCCGLGKSRRSKNFAPIPTHACRAFFHDLQKTVPFILHRNAEPGTIGAITHSLDCYANKVASDISIQFMRISAPDGRTKSIVITDASRIIEE